MLKQLRQSISSSSRPEDNRSGSGKLPSRHVSIHSNIAELPSAALDLLENNAHISFENCADWFRNLQQAIYPDDPGIRYYVMQYDGKPVAILPLRLEKGRYIDTIHSLSNYYTSLYTPILATDATISDLALLLKAAVDDYGSAQVMRFRPMDPDSPAYKTLLTALRSIGWIPIPFFCFGNWYQPVSDNWRDYFNQREGQLRSTIKRKSKKFVAAGGSLEIIADPSQVESANADYLYIYARSWKKPEPYPDFVPGLIRWLATKGWLRLGIARLNGNPVAAQLWIVNHGKASIFKLAYDEEHSSYSAGTLLTSYLMEHAIDTAQVQEVDYLTGDDPYKQQWMNRRRERWGIVAYNKRTLGGLLLLAREMIGLCRRAIRQAIFNNPKPGTE